MGNGMNKVLPGLYVGNYRDSKDQTQLERFQISHIVAIHDSPRRLLADKHYLCVMAADTPDQNLSQYFSVCNDFIHAARLREGNVLIHCLAGMSRSVTVAVAYIMTATNLNWKEALKVVRAGRAVANPNMGFQSQLQEFEMFRLAEERRRLRERFPSTALEQLDRSKCVAALDNYQELLQNKDICEGNCSRGEKCPTGGFTMISFQSVQVGDSAKQFIIFVDAYTVIEIRVISIKPMPAKDLPVPRIITTMPRFINFKYDVNDLLKLSALHCNTVDASLTPVSVKTNKSLIKIDKQSLLVPVGNVKASALSRVFSGAKLQSQLAVKQDFEMSALRCTAANCPSLLIEELDPHDENAIREFLNPRKIEDLHVKIQFQEFTESPDPRKTKETQITNTVIRKLHASEKYRMMHEIYKRLQLSFILFSQDFPKLRKRSLYSLSDVRKSFSSSTLEKRSCLKTCITMIPRALTFITPNSVEGRRNQKKKRTARNVASCEISSYLDSSDYICKRLAELEAQRQHTFIQICVAKPKPRKPNNPTPQMKRVSVTPTCKREDGDGKLRNTLNRTATKATCTNKIQVSTRKTQNNLCSQISSMSSVITNVKRNEIKTVKKASTMANGQSNKSTQLGDGRVSPKNSSFKCRPPRTESLKIKTEQKRLVDFSSKSATQNAKLGLGTENVKKREHEIPTANQQLLKKPKRNDRSTTQIPALVSKFASKQGSRYIGRNSLQNIVKKKNAGLLPKKSSMEMRAAANKCVRDLEKSSTNNSTVVLWRRSKTNLTGRSSGVESCKPMTLENSVDSTVPSVWSVDPEQKILSACRKSQQSSTVELWRREKTSADGTPHQNSSLNLYNTGSIIDFSDDDNDDEQMATTAKAVSSNVPPLVANNNENQNENIDSNRMNSSTSVCNMDPTKGLFRRRPSSASTSSRLRSQSSTSSAAVNSTGSIGGGSASLHSSAATPPIQSSCPTSPSHSPKARRSLGGQKIPEDEEAHHQCTATTSTEAAAYAAAITAAKLEKQQQQQQQQLQQSKKSPTRSPIVGVIKSPRISSAGSRLMSTNTTAATDGNASGRKSLAYTDQRHQQSQQQDNNKAMAKTNGGSNNFEQQQHLQRSASTVSGFAIRPRSSPAGLHSYTGSVPSSVHGSRIDLRNDNDKGSAIYLGCTAPRTSTLSLSSRGSSGSSAPPSPARTPPVSPRHGVRRATSLVKKQR